MTSGRKKDPEESGSRFDFICKNLALFFASVLLDLYQAGFLCGFAAAAALGGRRGWRFADQLSGPNGSDEALHAVIVKIDGGAFVIGFGDDAHAVLFVPDGLPFD
jgi:hypothetical protein